MVNSDYCMLLGDFTPMTTIYTDDQKPGQKTGALLDALSSHVLQLPLELQ